MQSSTTKQVSVANLTAGRNVSMSGGTVTSGGSIRSYRPDNAIYTDQYMAAGASGGYIFNNANGDGFKWQFGGVDQFTIDANGNFVQKVAAKGINFTANTPAAGMTSQLLNWYEEGTWTPTFNPSTSGTITSTDRGGRYTRIGRLVTIEGYINIASVSSPVGDLRISGLPFTIQNSAPGAGSVFQYGFGNLPAVTAVQMFAQGGATYCVIRGFLNGTQVSGYAANAQAGAGMQFSLTYSV